MAASNLGTEILEPPADGITSLFFSASDCLLASSWDGTARLYDSASHTQRQTYNHGAPVLDAAFEDESACYTAGLDARLIRFDLQTAAASVIGLHDNPVRCVEWLADRQLVASAGWDETLRLWDPRASRGNNCLATIPLPGKAFSMSSSNHRLVVATSQRQNLAFDTRRIQHGQPEMQRESSLKFQTRCLRCFPDAQAFVIGSVEGRVAVEYVDGSKAQGRQFAFRCHRRKEGGEDVAYPVNTIAFHPRLGTFATGGCDGVVNIWDPENKKRLLQISGYPTSIAALAFSSTGSQLAIAASYTFERGNIQQPPDTIYVRNMLDSEVKPKQRG